MSWSTLVWIDWGLVGVEALALLYMFARIATEKTRSPELSGDGLGFGLVLVGPLLALLLILAVLLFWFSRRENHAGIVVVSVALAIPLLTLATQPLVIGAQKFSRQQADAAPGSFRDPQLQAMSAAIRAGDAAQLKTLLAGHPPPEGTDKAGLDLLGFALVSVRDRKGSIECLQAILDSGVDLKKPRHVEDRQFLHYMLVDSAPASQEAARLLIRRGADPNAFDLQTPIRSAGHTAETVKALVDAGADINKVSTDGLSDVLYLTSTREWDSAIVLVESGARLDVVTKQGLSIDYYLKEWKDGVFGEQIEGWTRLREAILKRK